LNSVTVAIITHYYYGVLPYVMYIDTSIYVHTSI